MDIIWSIYAKRGGIYDNNKNPFGRDHVGFIWATSGAEAVEKYAAREGLEAAELVY